MELSNACSCLAHIQSQTRLPCGACNLQKRQPRRLRQGQPRQQRRRRPQLRRHSPRRATPSSARAATTEVCLFSVLCSGSITVQPCSRSPLPCSSAASASCALARTAGQAVCFANALLITDADVPQAAPAAVSPASRRPPPPRSPSMTRSWRPWPGTGPVPCARTPTTWTRTPARCARRPARTEAASGRRGGAGGAVACFQDYSPRIAAGSGTLDAVLRYLARSSAIRADRQWQRSTTAA